MHYRRAWVPGGTYFFTVALADRKSRLLVEEVEALRKALGKNDLEAGQVQKDKLSSLMRAAMGIAFFWLLASLAQMNIDVFGMEVLQLPGYTEIEKTEIAKRLGFELVGHKLELYGKPIPGAAPEDREGLVYKRHAHSVDETA